MPTPFILRASGALLPPPDLLPEGMADLVYDVPTLEAPGGNLGVFPFHDGASTLTNHTYYDLTRLNSTVLTPGSEGGVFQGRDYVAYTAPGGHICDQGRDQFQTVQDNGLSVLMAVRMGARATDGSLFQMRSRLGGGTRRISFHVNYQGKLAVKLTGKSVGTTATALNTTNANYVLSYGDVAVVGFRVVPEGTKTRVYIQRDTGATSSLLTFNPTEFDKGYYRHFAIGAFDGTYFGQGFDLAAMAMWGDGNPSNFQTVRQWMTDRFM
jgi:hypothetical protein